MARTKTPVELVTGSRTDGRHHDRLAAAVARGAALPLDDLRRIREIVFWARRPGALADGACVRFKINRYGDVRTAYSRALAYGTRTGAVRLPEAAANETGTEGGEGQERGGEPIKTAKDACDNDAARDRLLKQGYYSPQASQQ